MTEDELPVRDAPNGGTAWPSLAEATAVCTADVLYVETGRPVAYRLAERWHVDQPALHAEQAARRQDARDGAALQALRIVYSTGRVRMADVLAAASALGVNGLPALAAVDGGRVWPTGGQWVAQAGHTGKAIGNDLIHTWTQAAQAVQESLEAARDELAARLEGAGGLAARLAESRQCWEPATLEFYATEQQTEPRSLQLAASEEPPPSRRRCSASEGTTAKDL